MNDLTPDEIRKIMFHPENNSDVISVVRMPDGNWRGFMQKNGSLIQARQSDPGIVLQMLLTAK